MYNGIMLDGTLYDVRIVYGSIKRAFTIKEGKNGGESIGKYKIRDIIGTGYSYQMQIEPNPNNIAAYNAFYEAISAPIARHEVEMPYGDETITFDACIYSGTDTDAGMFANRRKWTGLTIVFEAYKPQREV